MRECLGIPEETERKYCKEVFNFVTEFTKKTRPEQTIVATSMFYFHKYCQVKSFNHFNRYLIGAVCVFLACKVKYMPLGLEKAVTAFYEMEFKMSNPTIKKIPKISKNSIYAYSDDFKLKELEVLEMLGFDFDTHLPYPFLANMQGALGETLSTISSNFLNDSFIGSASLFFHPKLIAAGCIQLAIMYLGKNKVPFELPATKDGRPWWKLIDVDLTEEMILEAKNEIKKVYL